jgi:hypothetical protein
VVKDDAIPHGTYAGYKKGCRCDACAQGRREYERLRRERPEVKQRRSEYNKSAERKERARERARTAWEEPTVRQKARESRRAREQRPEYKARKREYERQRKKRPERMEREVEPAEDARGGTLTRYIAGTLSYLQAEQASAEPYRIFLPPTPASQPARKAVRSGEKFEIFKVA